MAALKKGGSFPGFCLCFVLSPLSATEAPTLETICMNTNNISDLRNAADCTKEQVLSEYLQELSPGSKGLLFFCFAHYAVQCKIAPCCRWVQILEH